MINDGIIKTPQRSDGKGPQKMPLKKKGNDTKRRRKVKIQKSLQKTH